MDTMEKFLLHSCVTSKGAEAPLQGEEVGRRYKVWHICPPQIFSPSVLQCPPLITALVKIITANIYLGNVIVRLQHTIHHSSGVVHDIGIVVRSLLGPRG